MAAAKNSTPRHITYVGAFPEKEYRKRMYHGMPHVRGRRLLNRVVDYLHGQSEHARSEEEFELFSVTLRWMGCILEGGWTDPFVAAWPMALGVSMEKYRRRVAARRAFWQNEVDRAIPDFDPGDARQASLQHFGRWRFEVQDGEEMHMEELPQTTLPAERKPVQRAFSAEDSERTETRKRA